MLAIVSSAYFIGTLVLGLSVLIGSLWDARADIARALGFEAPVIRRRLARVSIKRRVRMAPVRRQALRAAA
jgi:hypothetical protein